MESQTAVGFIDVLNVSFQVYLITLDKWKQE